MLRPTSGSFLGPKTRVATPAITTSSGIPSPNIQLQEKPLFLVLAGMDLCRWTRFKGLNVAVKKDEFDDENREVDGVRCGVVGV